MGCLGIGLAALLALAVPASVARASLVGAYVVIALLAVLAAGAAVWTAGRQRPDSAGPPLRLPSALSWIGVLTAAYVVAVTIIHATG